MSSFHRLMGTVEGLDYSSIGLFDFDFSFSMSFSMSMDQLGLCIPVGTMDSSGITD
jgi:hypothetical protein